MTRARLYRSLLWRSDLRDRSLIGAALWWSDARWDYTGDDN